MEKFKSIINSKAIKIMGSVLYYALVVLIVAVLAVVVLQRVSNNNLTIGGVRIFNIVSESMVPKYVIGDILISKSVDASELKVGDDVAYLGEVGTFNGKVVTHQIISIDESTGEIITKGIANPEQDPPIKASQIYGKIIYHVKSLSFISKIINNIFGFYFLIFVPITILIVIKIKDIIISIKDKKNEAEEDDDDENEETAEGQENEKDDSEEDTNNSNEKNKDEENKD